MFNGALSIPPASGVNYASWLSTGFVFQFWLRRKRFAWWSKVRAVQILWRGWLADSGAQYNYVLSAALDVGTALSAVALFLFIDLPGASLSWWGNNVYKQSKSPSHSHISLGTDKILIAVDWDGVGATYYKPPPEGFGPDTWKV